MSARRFAIGTASTQALGERAAVDDIIEQLPEGAAGCTVLFCSTRYDLGQLGRALQAAGRTQVVGAATGRAIGGGRFLADGITGFHLPAGRFKIAKTLIEDAASFRLPDARELVRSLRGRLENGENSRLPHQFGILLVDAEVRCEERLIAALGTELGGVPIAGGSAGDIYFNPSGHAPGSTRMLYGRRGLSGAAVFCLVSCDSQVVALSHTHYIPGDRKLVITDADPERRLVREIDGRSALLSYAEALNLKERPQPGDGFERHPLMIRIGGQYFARGPQRAYEDGSMEFACAMESGLVVTVAQPGNMIERLQAMFESLHAAIGPPELVIGFDCAARTAYMEQRELTPAVSALFQRHAVVGFSTLGEQFNTVHVNNSFTCVGIAAR